ncbi:MAG: hypothetical protein AMJ59_16210 [Gammaproteobacteria bacterium SG8_31]|jgi:DUF4097 and DUF4098 domain-containing protein YvlB|nr:MAG: hypothetical protein AMJ59_16210 [Gammaproteobacteria bacterium SG8_31]
MRVLIVSTLLTLTAAPAWSGTAIDEIADAHPRGEVEVSNVSGEIKVTGWNKEQVQISGRLGDGSERLVFERDGRRTLIKVEVPSRSRKVESSDLYVMVPEESRVTVTGVSADITVEGVKGALRIQSVSGEIFAEVFEEDVETKTVSGDLRIRGHDSPALLTLTTVSGDGRVENIRGELVVQSVTGNLDIKSKALDRARLRTTNGDIDLQTGLGSDALFDMEAINGDLRLDILGDVDAYFDIETFNGSIDNSFGPDPVRASKYAPGRNLRFTHGEGKARVRIKTLNGGVTLRGE